MSSSSLTPGSGPSSSGSRACTAVPFGWSGFFGPFILTPWEIAQIPLAFHPFPFLPPQPEPVKHTLQHHLREHTGDEGGHHDRANTHATCRWRRSISSAIRV